MKSPLDLQITLTAFSVRQVMGVDRYFEAPFCSFMIILPNLVLLNRKSNIFLRLFGDKSSNGVSNSLFLVLGVRASDSSGSLSLSVSVAMLSEPELMYHVVLDLWTPFLLPEVLGKVLLW